MLFKKKIIIAIALLFLVFSFSAPTANANGNEYKKIVSHLKTKYRAKKVKIPFMFLARFAVSIVRPAGVKSFSVTLFEDLKFSRETLDTEMQSMMRNSFNANWSPIFRVRSRDGQQAYMYMSEAGKTSVKIALLTIDKAQAAVIRATFSPERLTDFINDPKIFGISLDSKEQQAKNKISEPEENIAPENKIENSKKDN
jgi:hypothetical protein